MLAAERRTAILAAARRDGVARVADMAALLGVSDVTVRRDMEALAAEGLVDKVHGGAVLTAPASPDAAEAPRPAVRNGAAPGGHVLPAPGGELPPDGPVVGVLVPKSPYYFKGIVDGIRQTVGAAGGRMLIAVSEYTPDREAELVQGLLDSGAQGLLLAPAAAEDRWVTRDGAGALPVPAVLVERQGGPGSPAAPPLSWVRTAHQAGVLRAVAHLRELGHERVALFARGDTATSRAVLDGWRQAVAALGLPAGLPEVRGADVPGWPLWNTAAVRAFAGRLREANVTALVCHSDEDALALLQNGLADELPVPRALSVIAYDDELSEYTSPALTAVSPPKQHVGRLAAQTLLELLTDPTAPPRQIDVQPALVLRGSCRAPARD